MLSSGAREAGVGGDRPQRRANESLRRNSTVNRARRQDEWRQPSTPNGELFTKTDSETGEVWTYHYDALGNLLSVDLPDGRLIEYVIDGQNRRIGKRIDGILVRAWLYKDQLKPIAELDGSGNITARFIYGSKTNVPDVILRYAAATVTRYRVISDHLGSPVMAVNVDNPADVPFAAEYSAFGEMTVTSGASSNEWMPFGFAGGLYDADTELVRFGARDYDAVTGRWTAKDPIIWRGMQANLYGYVGSDGVNLRDPTGLEVEVCRRLAETPVFDLFGAQHQWIRTDTKEAGILGTWTDTRIEGHPGFGDRSDSVCTAVHQVDEACVNSQLELGKEQGPWLPWSNCSTFVSDVISTCAIPYGPSPIGGSEGAGGT